MDWSVEFENMTIEKARKGDPQAFDLLYVNYYRYVLCLCLRLTSDAEISEDLCQDVFLQLWKKICTFRGESKFKTWLHRVVTNIVYMHFRQQRRHPHPEENNPTGNDERTLEDRLSSSASYLPDHRLLCQTISALRPQYRTILKLHDIAGYEHNEIAEMLCIPSGTSKSHLHRARRQIREMLETPSQPLAQPRAA
jgi:RNA polymerase sigma-70 factor (ECF subfamily)